MKRELEYNFTEEEIKEIFGSVEVLEEMLAEDEEDDAEKLEYKGDYF